MDGMPLYKRIFQDLQKKITLGEYPIGTRLPPERTLSEAYGVVRPTLRKALSLLEEQGYIERVQGAGNKVVYSLTLQERAQSKRSGSIVYVMPNSLMEQGPQPYHMEICAHLEKLCAAKDQSLIFTKARPVEGCIPGWLQTKHVSGVILVSEVDASVLQAVGESEIPAILCCNDSPIFPRVTLDDVGGAYIAIDHLVSRGCKNICHITGVRESHNARRELEGFHRAMLAHGCPVLSGNIQYGDWSYASGFQLAYTALVEQPAIDGFFAGNDLMALGAMRAVIQLGRRVPEDIKIVGMDDIEQAQNNVIPLSTVRFAPGDVAAALHLMLSAAALHQAVPAEMEIPGTLVVRSST